MPKLFAALALACLPLLALTAPVRAQQSDGFFADYQAYDAYVDKMLTTRQWVEFVKNMGGRDEFSDEDLAKINDQFNGLFPNNFTARTMFRETDLGGNVRQEARAYWGAGRYLFFYAILHERGDALVVLNFSINTKVEAVMRKF